MGVVRVEWVPWTAERQPPDPASEKQKEQKRSSFYEMASSKGGGRQATRILWIETLLP